MEFLTVEFFAFLIVVATIIYHCKDSHRNFWLLMASLYFYYRCDQKYFIFMILLGSLTYVLGFVVAKKKIKLIYGLGSLGILLFLIYFKYSHFIIEVLSQFIVWGQESQFSCFQKDIIMPLGISFMTFQAISYLGDIYYQKIDIEKNYINVLLVICFFPNVTSGPIQKAKHMLSELKSHRDFNFHLSVHGISRIAYGALQKYYISDNLAPIITNMLGNINDYSGFQYLFFAAMFAIYIYSNFNSYSDIAIGTSEILGIHLTENFRRPYLSKSVKEFWQRWHISLNSWFVEYVYIPLGGNRKGKMKHFLNIILVFLLSGLWHGVGFHFIVWGLLNAFYQIVGIITSKKRNELCDKLKINRNSSVIVWGKRLLVFYLISISWIFFAVPSTVGGIKIVKSMIFPSLESLFDNKILELFSSSFHLVIILSIIFIFAMIQLYREKHSILEYIQKKPSIVRNSIYVCVTILLLLGYFRGFTSYGNGGFIYGGF